MLTRVIKASKLKLETCDSTGVRIFAGIISESI